LVLNTILRSITTRDNETLTTPFCFDQFKEAIFSMQAAQCLDLDSFNLGFYQHFRNIHGQEIM